MLDAPLGLFHGGLPGSKLNSGYTLAEILVVFLYGLTSGWRGKPISESLSSEDKDLYNSQFRRNWEIR